MDEGRSSSRAGRGGRKISLETAAASPTKLNMTIIEAEKIIITK